jgi:hypothetical protein
LRKSKNRIQHATLYSIHTYTLHSQGSHTVKSRAPTCLDSRHRGCLCVTPIPHSQFHGAIRAFRAKGQRQTSYDKGPVLFRMKPIFAFSNDRRAWNSSRSSNSKGLGRTSLPCTSTTGIYNIHSFLSLLYTLKRVTYRILTSFILRCQIYSTNSKLYSPTQTQTQIPNPDSKYPEPTATPYTGVWHIVRCGDY